MFGRKYRLYCSECKETFVFRTSGEMMAFRMGSNDICPFCHNGHISCIPQMKFDVPMPPVKPPKEKR
jgi:hypothetical protein